MQIKLSAILTILALIFGCTTITKTPKDWNRKCGEIPNSTMRYCSYVVGEKPSTKTLWYFHGLLDSENALDVSVFDQKPLKDLISGLGSVSVVVVSYGPGWLLVPDKAIGPYKISDFQKNVIPYLEKTLSLPKPFIAIGHSMGGYNLLSSLIYDQSVFSKAVLVAPMVISNNTDPWKKGSFCPACLMIKSNYSQTDWKEFSPYMLIKDDLKYPQTMVLACKADVFNLFDGAKEIALKIKAEFIQEPVGCTHATFDSKTISTFLK